MPPKTGLSGICFIDSGDHTRLVCRGNRVFVVCFFTQEVEHLRVGHTDQEVEAGVRIRHDEEERGPLVAYGIQVQLVICGNIAKFLNIKDGETGSAADQDGLRCFS